jgi:hypothetical protein
VLTLLILGEIFRIKPFNFKALSLLFSTLQHMRARSNHKRAHPRDYMALKCKRPAEAGL